jgi:hypothetical protein
MRHPEPDFIKVWKEGVPQCCHTCENYAKDGICILHWAEPPEQFANTKNACEDWIYELPF